MNKQAQLQKEASFVDGFVDSLEDNGISAEQFVKAASNAEDPSIRKVAAAMIDLAELRSQTQSDRTKQASPLLAGLGGAAIGAGASGLGGALANPDDPSAGAKKGVAGVLSGPLMAPEGEGWQAAGGALGGGLLGSLGTAGAAALSRRLGANPARVSKAIGDALGSSPASKGSIAGMAGALPGATASGYGAAKGFDYATSDPEQQGTMDKLKSSLGM